MIKILFQVRREIVDFSANSNLSHSTQSAGLLQHNTIEVPLTTGTYFFTLLEAGRPNQSVSMVRSDKGTLLPCISGRPPSCNVLTWLFLGACTLSLSPFSYKATSLTTLELYPYDLRCCCSVMKSCPTLCSKTGSSVKFTSIESMMLI